MIQVDSLKMQYGNFVALSGVSFKAREREVLGLLGPNGAGKTTAMRILTTYLHPSAGNVSIGPHNIIDHPLAIRKQIGYLPETAPLYPDMQTEEYLTFVAQARGLKRDYLQDRLKWVRDACDIKFIWKHRVNELSKGYRQRVGLAQALIHDPKVLILDEPTSGLDPLQIIGIRRLVKDLAQTKTIIFSTHILQEVEAIADRVVIINQGKIVSQGTQQELKDQARSRGETKDNLTLEDIFIALLSPKGKRISV